MSQIINKNTRKSVRIVSFLCLNEHARAVVCVRDNSKKTDSDDAKITFLRVSFSTLAQLERDTSIKEKKTISRRKHAEAAPFCVSGLVSFIFEPRTRGDRVRNK